MNSLVSNAQGLRRNAISVLTSKYSNFDVSTEVRADTRMQPPTAVQRPYVRVDAKITVFDYSDDKARTVKVSKATAEAASLEEAEDAALVRAIDNLGILGGGNE